MEYLISGILLIIAIIALFFQIKEYLKKHKIAKFEGRIGKDENDGKGTGKFINFIFKNENKIIHIDICIDNEESHEIDKEGIFHFSCYYDLNNKLNGGYAFRIQVNKNDDFFYDCRPSSKRLVGNFKVIGITGPQQGWFTALLKPINIEQA